MKKRYAIQDMEYVTKCKVKEGVLVGSIQCAECPNCLSDELFLKENVRKKISYRMGEVECKARRIMK